MGILGLSQTHRALLYYSLLNLIYVRAIIPPKRLEICVISNYLLFFFVSVTNSQFLVKPLMYDLYPVNVLLVLLMKIMCVCVFFFTRLSVFVLRTVIANVLSLS